MNDTNGECDSVGGNGGDQENDPSRLPASLAGRCQPSLRSSAQERQNDITTIRCIICTLGSPTNADIVDMRLEDQAVAQFRTLQHIPGVGVKQHLTRLLAQSQSQSRPPISRCRDSVAISSCALQSLSLVNPSSRSRHRMHDDGSVAHNPIFEATVHLLCAMLQYSPFDRFGAKSCLSHRYFVEVEQLRMKRANSQRMMEQNKSFAVSMMRGN